MRFKTPENRQLLALGGTLCLLTLMALGSLWAFKKGEGPGAFSVQKSVGMDLCMVDAPRQHMAPPPPQAAEGEAVPEFQPQKLVRTAHLTLEIEDYGRFAEALKPLGQRVGYLSGLQVDTDEKGRRKASLTLRVEASRFESTLIAFKALGKVKTERISVDDVTRRYADLEARRANKRVAGARLREIIQSRAGKISEVIEAEEALSRVTEELEGLEAQKRGLEGQLAFSTIQAEVAEPITGDVAEKPGFWKPLRAAFEDSCMGLVQSLALLLKTLIILLPWGFAVALGWLGWWGFRRRSGLREKPAGEES